MTCDRLYRVVETSASIRDVDVDGGMNNMFQMEENSQQLVGLEIEGAGGRCRVVHVLSYLRGLWEECEW